MFRDLNPSVTSVWPRCDLSLGSDCLNSHWSSRTKGLVPSVIKAFTLSLPSFSQTDEPNGWLCRKSALQDFRSIAPIKQLVKTFEAVLGIDPYGFHWRGPGEVGATSRVPELITDAEHWLLQTAAADWRQIPERWARWRSAPVRWNETWKHLKLLETRPSRSSVRLWGTCDTLNEMWTEETADYQSVS